MTSRSAPHNSSLCARAAARPESRAIASPIAPHPDRAGPWENSRTAMTLRVVRTAATIVVVLLVSWPVHAQDHSPAASTPQAAGASDLHSLQNDFRRLVEANQLTQALPVARRIVEVSEGASLAQRIGAHFDLASLMRELDDLDGAILE